MSSLSLPGLSGYDFSGIIQAMVAQYKEPETQMINQKTELQTEQSAWQDINTKLSALNNSLTTLQSASTWDTMKATTSNSSLLTATADSTAVAGTYNINVINTAQAQTVVSSVQNVTSATSATSVSAGSFTITANGSTSTINVNAGDSLSTIATSINNANAGVTAGVVQVAGGYQLAIVDNKTGSANASAYADVGSGTILQDLGLVNSSNQLNISQAAKDANITVNGITNITSSTNTFASAIPGVTIDVNGADNGASTINLTIGADSSTAQSAVQSFVTNYNAAMNLIDNDLSYDPTTHQAGVLMGDSVLQSIATNLRSMVASSLNNPTGPYLTMSSVGIDTSSANFGESPDLSLNTDKFTAACQANLQSVANLFGAPFGGVTPSQGTSSSPQGLANVLNNYLNPYVEYGGTLSQTTTSLGNQIEDLTKQISDFDQQASAYQESLSLKFANLEATLSQLNSEGSWLSNTTSKSSKSS